MADMQEWAQKVRADFEEFCKEGVKRPAVQGHEVIRFTPSEDEVDEYREALFKPV